VKQIYQDNIEIQSSKDWGFKRREWFKLAIAGLVVSQLPWFVSCDSHSSNTDKIPNLDGKDIFSKEEMETLYIIQNILVPNDGNGPSAADVNAHQYFVWTMQDEKLSTKDKSYFKDKLIAIMELCREKFGKNFIALSPEDQALFITNNIESGWTRSYFSRMITVIFEAMLLDPIYGGNINEIGWDWLNHIPGSPRPSKETKYPNIYNNIEVYG